MGAGAAYRGDFPVVTIRDTVRLHSLLVEHALKITDVFCVVGGTVPTPNASPNASPNDSPNDFAHLRTQ